MRNIGGNIIVYNVNSSELGTMIKKNRSNIVLIVTLSIVAIITITSNINNLFSFLLLTWLFLFLFFIRNWKDNVVMIAFLFTFYVFLMGREVYYNFTLSNDLYVINDVAATVHTYRVMVVSLLTVCISYFLFKKHDIAPKNTNSILRLDDEFVERFKIIARSIFYMTYIFLLLDLWYKALYIQEVGYVASYTENAVGPGTPWIVEKLALLSKVSFFCFLASFPSKKEVRLSICLYAIYGVLTLLTGQRYPLIAVVAMIVIYFAIRNAEDGLWIKKHYYIIAALSIPFASIGLLAVDAIRLGGVFEFTNIFDGFIDFFTVQGGSINVIKLGKSLESEIPTDRLYTINSILSNILNLNPFEHNSLEYAFDGNSFAAIMSVLEYGTSEYLAGHGVGTSYIAELYHDFGYIGIVLGNVFYGWLIYLIQSIKKGALIENTFLLLMISPLLFSPRGEFDGVIGETFRRGHVVFSLLVIIIVIANMKISPTSVFDKKELY